MMRSHKLVRMALLIGLLAGALWLSRSIPIAEQPAAAAPNPKSAAGAAASDQGSQAEQEPEHRATRRASYGR